MVTTKLPKKIMIFLFRNFNENNTISSIARELSMNRVGIWRILKKLESQNFVKLLQTVKGKTETYIVKLNWENILLEKLLLFYLAEEAQQKQKWVTELEKVKNIVDFIILHENNVISIVPSKKIKIHYSSNELQEENQINTIELLELEFIKELIKPNKDFVDAVKKGSVLLGQEKFIQLMKDMHLKKFGF